ncbi:MAG TPA: YihY/virulence factor BrkB family protein [Lacunisphaera sp.]|nr:YihY/virulence factor BrkB family protein [Lacunisphaera sp.]
MRKWLRILWTAAKAWKADNAFKHSAAVSFYTLFSLAPMTIIAVTVAGVFLGREEANRQFIAQVSGLVGPASSEMIQQAAEASQNEDNSALKTAIGIALMIFGATTVFAQLQDSLNKIWGVRAKPNKSGWLILLMHRLVSLAMVLTIGFLLLVSLILSTLLTGLLARFETGLLASKLWMQAADLVVGLAVISALFAVLFKVMPDVKLRWRDVWIGAIVTAVLFTIGRRLIALYLGYSTVASIYGTAGSLVALLIWVYYSCAILFYGVEFTRAYREQRNLKIEPKETAVQVREEIVPNDGGDGPPRVDLT